MGAMSYPCRSTIRTAPSGGSCAVPRVVDGHRRVEPVPTGRRHSGSGSGRPAGSARRSFRSRKALPANRIGDRYAAARRSARPIGPPRWSAAADRGPRAARRSGRRAVSTISGQAAAASQVPPVLGYQRRNAGARPSSTNRCRPPSSRSGTAWRDESSSWPDRIVAKTPPASTSLATSSNSSSYIGEPEAPQNRPCDRRVCTRCSVLHASSSFEPGADDVERVPECLRQRDGFVAQPVLVGAQRDPEHRPGDGLGQRVGRLDAQPAGDEPGHHLAPAGVHRHRIGLQLSGLQDDPHALAVPDGLALVKGVERQQRRAQRLAQRNPRVDVVEQVLQVREVGVEVAPQDGVLGRVVAEQRAARDAGRLRDIVDAHLGETRGR